MFTTSFGKSVLAALLIASGAVLVACDSQQQAVDDGDKTEARANVDAMSREHAEDTTEASPAAEVAPVQEVLVDPRMPYAEIENELVYGYLAVPADMFEPLPALIVIHEWWGLNDNVRAMADRLAAEGYMVLAVDLYGGKTADTPAGARELMLRVVEQTEQAKANLRSAYEFLEATGAPQIASLGWCFGGGWSLNTALLLPRDLDAAVIYYGQVTADDEKLAPLDVPLLGLFGAEDTGIKLASVEAFREALVRLDKEHEIHIYPGAKHAFANPTGRNYNADAANDAWLKTLDFLERHLSAGET